MTRLYSWLRVISFLVPAQQREDWLQEWISEFHYTWGDGGSGQRNTLTAFFRCCGALRDALRLRVRQPRRSAAPILQTIWEDIRFGVRTFARSPGFTMVALATMALGIGANTAIFSLVSGVLLEPLPFPDSGRIVYLQEANPSRGFRSFTVSPLNFWDWQERNRSLDLMAAYQRNPVTYAGGDRPERLDAVRVTTDFLEILGGRPVLGRAIIAEDLDPGRTPVVVLTYGYWQRAFAADTDVLDFSINLDGVPHAVVGVLDENWKDITSATPDVILPLRPTPWWYANRQSHFLYALGRIKPETTLDQVRADLASVAGALQEEYPDTNAGWEVLVRPLKEVLVGPARPQLLIFMITVTLVLMIGCANLANMTLARAMQRDRELGIRLAMGASRIRIIRQLLTESVLLASVGGAIGIILAAVGLRTLVAGWPEILPRLHEVEMNAFVLLFTIALSWISGILFGLAPAMNMAGPDLVSSVRSGVRGIAGGRSGRWGRTSLVVGEVCLAALLLVAAGLLARSLFALNAEDPGFRKANRLVFSTPLPQREYPQWSLVNAFGNNVLDQLEVMPGVESAALASLVPLAGNDNMSGLWREDRPSSSPENGPVIFYRVSPDYFETMGIPLLAGRGVAREDSEDTRRVVVVSTSVAERYFPGENPIGQRIRFRREEDQQYLEIVGVVGDVQHGRLGQPSIPQVYVAYAQDPSRYVSFVLKTSVPPLNLAEGIRESIASIDSNQPVVDIKTLDAMISDSISMPQFRVLLMTGSAITALVLAVLGVYGVMAYIVSQRTKELGVRMALGATRTSILWMVFRDGLPPVGIGLGIGMVGAFASSRALESMLFGVSAQDLGVFVAVPLVLAGTAALAMLIPARKAALSDPAATLVWE